MIFFSITSSHLPLTFPTRLSSFAASSVLPLHRSHEGDSGRNLMCVCHKMRTATQKYEKNMNLLVEQRDDQGWDRGERQQRPPRMYRAGDEGDDDGGGAEGGHKGHQGEGAAANADIFNNWKRN